LVDNRPAAVAQRELAEMLNNSPRVLQQRALSDAIHNNSSQMAALFGAAVRPQGDGAMPAGLLPVQSEEKPNNTGLPNQLKSGIESLSGTNMDHVKVHYNSDKPAQLQAHAYAQGSEIHLGTGQERHLPHEAWHIVQQAQGRVKPSMQMKAGVSVNDDEGLEAEADVMGAKAAGLVQRKAEPGVFTHSSVSGGSVVQRLADLVSQVVVTDGFQGKVGAPVQMMKWRMKGEDLVPMDRDSKQDIDVSVSFPGYGSMAEGDVWDDKSGNIYDANTGRLKKSVHRNHASSPVLPEQFLVRLAAIENPDHAKLEGPGGVKSHRLKINELRSAITEWLWGDSEESPTRPWMTEPDGQSQAVEKTEGGYAPAAEHLLMKLETLKDVSMLLEDAPKVPKTLGGKMAMAFASAQKTLYEDVGAPDFANLGKKDLKVIASKEDEEEIDRFSADQSTMTPKGEAMNWWTSAAKGLAEHTKGSVKDNLVYLSLAGVSVPIAIKPKSAENPEGEFIILGVGAPLVRNADKANEGIQTPKSAEAKHRVSYPAFIMKLATVRSAKEGNPVMDDAAIAGAMLQMVRDPHTAPASVMPDDLPIVVEAVTTWMVAEPARHPSVAFNSVMALETISEGEKTFASFMNDAGEHPMSGSGTAKAGRGLRDNEVRALAGENVTDLTKDKTGKRQAKMLGDAAGKGQNLAAPLERILRDYAGKDVKIRYLSNDTR